MEDKLSGERAKFLGDDVFGSGLLFYLERFVRPGRSKFWTGRAEVALRSPGGSVIRSGDKPAGASGSVSRVAERSTHRGIVMVNARSHRGSASVTSVVEMSVTA